FSHLVPGLFNCNLTHSLNQASNNSKAATAKLFDQLSWSKTFMARQPRLHGVAHTNGTLHLPVVFICEELNKQWPEHALLVFSLHAKDCVTLHIAEHVPTDAQQFLLRDLSAYFHNAATHSDTPLASLSLLNANDEEQLIHAWNTTASHVPEPHTIHERFD